MLWFGLIVYDKYNIDMNQAIEKRHSYIKKIMNAISECNLFQSILKLIAIHESEYLMLKYLIEKNSLLNHGRRTNIYMNYQKAVTANERYTSQGRSNFFTGRADLVRPVHLKKSGKYSNYIKTGSNKIGYHSIVVGDVAAIIIVFPGINNHLLKNLPCDLSFIASKHTIEKVLSLLVLFFIFQIKKSKNIKT